MKETLYIIADDLTGSNDTAIQFSKNGMKCIVPVLKDASRFSGFDAVTINTDSRMLPSDKSYEITADMIKGLKGISANNVYKKIDSQLRGNPGTELKAVMDTLGYKSAFIAPSFPKNNRLIENGLLKLKDKTVDALDLFKKQMGCDVKLFRKGEMPDASDEGVFLFDASSDEDLAKIAEKAKEMKTRPLLCGCAALASFMVQPKNSCVLSVCGSLHAISKKQYEIACDFFNIKHIPFDCKNDDLSVSIERTYESFSKHFAEGDKKIVILTSSMFDGTIYDVKNASRSLEIAQALGTLTRKICDNFDIKGLILNGGDTSLCVLKALEADGIIPSKEVQSGVPMGTIVGGCKDSLPVITKSGGLGNDNAIIDCLNSVSEA